MKRKKTKVTKNISIKPRTLEIGTMLANQMFQLQHTEPSIEDVIERLIILEGFKYGVLNEVETKKVLAFYGQDVKEPSSETVIHEDTIMPLTGTVMPLAGLQLTEHKYNPSELPLGQI